MFTYEIYKALPPTMRIQIKKLLNSNGHAASILDGLKAKKDAQGKRRLDRALEHMVVTMERAGCLPQCNSRALDFGSGYVLTDAVALWLLGAREIVAVDLNPIARREALKMAVAGTSLEEIERIAAGLPPPSQEVAVNRAKRLLSALDAELDRLPISYAAPVDILDGVHDLGHFDAIWSCSVLEHIPPKLLVRILQRLDELRTPGGQGCHFVDLRDHLDFRQPFQFHSHPEGYEPERDADARGNGLNVREWRALLSRLPGFQIHPVGEPTRVSTSGTAGSREYYEFSVLTHGGRNQ